MELFVTLLRKKRGGTANTDLPLVLFFFGPHRFSVRFRFRFLFCLLLSLLLFFLHGQYRNSDSRAPGITGRQP